MVDTIVEGINAAFEDAKAEGIGEALVDVVAYWFPAETEVFRQFVTSF